MNKKLPPPYMILGPSLVCLSMTLLARGHHGLWVLRVVALGLGIAAVVIINVLYVRLHRQARRLQDQVRPSEGEDPIDEQPGG